MAEIECPNCGQTFAVELDTGDLEPDTVLRDVTLQPGNADWVECPNCEETFYPGYH